MRALSVLLAAFVTLIAACSEAAPARPSDVDLQDESADIIRAVYASDEAAFLGHYPQEDRTQVWNDAGDYVERYGPFGPITVEVAEVLMSDAGVNVTVRYATAAGVHCQTFVLFRPGRDSYHPALHPLSPTVDGCIGAWGGSDQ